MITLRFSDVIFVIFILSVIFIGMLFFTPFAIFSAATHISSFIRFGMHGLLANVVNGNRSETTNNIFFIYIYLSRNIFTVLKLPNLIVLYGKHSLINVQIK